ncbi:MAG: hypothetical protein ACJKTH_02010 [Patescibacteria group bacterium UBA2163]
METWYENSNIISIKQSSFLSFFFNDIICVTNKQFMKYLLIAVFTWFIPQSLFAHGLGQRIDLPIPLDIYLGAAAAALIASFFLIGFLGKREKSYDTYPKKNLCSIKLLQTVLLSPITVNIIKLIAVGFLGVLLYAGFWGDQTPTNNILPIFVWVGFTVGLTYFIAFVGNVWPLINPWKALGEFIDKKERWSFKREWPVWLGVWPAFVLFFIFRYLENIAPNATDPSRLAWYVVGFSVITFTGFIVFGRAQWLRYGDPFSLFYRFLSHFAIFSYEEKEGQKHVYLRLPAVGLLNASRVSFSEMAFVLLMLVSVSFDGISSTPFAVGILNGLRDIGLGVLSVKVALFVGVFAFFALVYATFVLLIRNYGSLDKDLLTIAKEFILSLLPIAIVYEVVHFMVLLLTEGQRLFILASDPFGFGWDLFGSASWKPNYGFIDFNLLWNIQIALILFGHIASIYIAHMVALRVCPDAKKAVRSQIPMLILMVGYTVMGLWILAQPPALF